MYKFVAGVSLFWLLTGCEDPRGVNFVVHNKSAAPIDSVFIRASGDTLLTKIYEISPGMSRNAWLHLSQFDTTEGNYIVHIMTSVKGETYEFIGNIGKYEAGIPSEKRMDIWFSPDSIHHEPTPRLK